MRVISHRIMTERFTSAEDYERFVIELPTGSAQVFVVATSTVAKVVGQDRRSEYPAAIRRYLAAKGHPGSAAEGALRPVFLVLMHDGGVGASFDPDMSTAEMIR